MPFGTRTLLNPRIQIPSRPINKRAIFIPPPGSEEARLQSHKAVLAGAGINDISTLGTLEYSGNMSPTPGIHLPASSEVAERRLFQSAFQLTRASGKFVSIGGSADVVRGIPLNVPPQPARAALRDVLRVDKAYFVANEIKLAAGTNVVVSYPNLHCIFICNKLTVGDNVTFTWDRPHAADGSVQGKPVTPDPAPPSPESTTIDKPAPGYPGTPGTPGGKAPNGADAPSLEIWADQMTGAPAVDLRGQGYSQLDPGDQPNDPNHALWLKGGPGGDGGQGGQGAAGKRAVAESYFGVWISKAGPGNGGDGGPGGAAGDGGNGGNGGRGGDFALFAPQSAITAFQQRHYVTTDGGPGGPGGDPGEAGQGGAPGQVGENPHNCNPSTRRYAGNPGAKGAPGKQGNAGVNGDHGWVTIQAIEPGMVTKLMSVPAICSLTPSAYEGDSVPVDGRNLTGNEVVVVEGVEARTVPMADTTCTFIVPAVQGGRRIVQLRQPDGTLSNAATLYVQPKVTAAVHADGTPSVDGRLTPGAVVALTGTGFADGMRVLIAGQEMPNVSVFDSHRARFTLVRPNSAPNDRADGEPVDLIVILPETSPWCASERFPIVLDTFVMLVAGDSVVWGQGLNEDQKFHTIVENELRQKSGGMSVYKKVFAHSGAIIGLHPADDQPLPLIDGEVPSGYPTIRRQLAESPFPNEDVDLILMDGGANDVDFRTILNPLTPSSTVAERTNTVLYGDMSTVLGELLTKYPQAQIIVTGYYEVLSRESDTFPIEALLMALGIDVANIAGAIAGGMLAEWAIGAARTNCEVFAAQGNANLRRAVDEANASLGEGRPPRVFFADPTFGPDNATFAPKSFVYGINPDLSPVDPIAPHREAACEENESRAGVLDISKRASAGHPNPAGARAYADAILAQIAIATAAKQTQALVTA